MTSSAAPSSRAPAPLPADPRQGLGRGAPVRGGFSLIEVVVVFVLLGIIAAIAIPRLSRGSEGSIEAAVSRDLSVLQKAIDLYAAEHDGAFPNPNVIAEQLTRYTDAKGTVSTQKVGSFNYGPYVRKIPPVKVGPNKGNTAIATSPGSGVGWIYNPVEGTIAPNTTAPILATQPSNSVSLPAVQDPLEPITEPIEDTINDLSL